MGRAPCCDKMGLKKGPWTPIEDEILISYIQKHGHSNWRALPKQAGLLRCGKSCRLRWINYLRPDIKRGNFTLEEEESIMKFHEMLGNRWSAIAAKLPGRTDNEIKNVWHTHLKKRSKNYQTSRGAEAKYKSKTNAPKVIEPTNSGSPSSHNTDSPLHALVSPPHSSSEMSSVTYSLATNGMVNDCLVAKHEEMDSSEYIPQIDESFWSDEPNSSIKQPKFVDGKAGGDYSARIDEDADFWYNIFIKAGDFPDLSEF